MNQDVEYLGKPAPGTLMEALREEGFLADYMETTPILHGLEQMVEWFKLKDSSGDIAYLAQMIGPDPTCATVWIFIQRKGSAKELKPEFREFGVILWDLWFRQMKLERVQSLIPLSKLKHIKLLSSWRFQEETRMGGMRRAMRVDGRWQDVSMMGLVLSDCPVWWRNSLNQEA